MKLPAFTDKARAYIFAGLVIIMIAGVFPLSGNCTAFSKEVSTGASSSGFKPIQLKSFTLSGGGFCLSAEAVRLYFRGDNSIPSLIPGVDAEGLRLKVEDVPRVKTGALRSLFEAGFYSIPWIRIKNGEVLFEAGPDFLGNEGISFEGFTLTPGDKEDASFEVRSLSLGDLHVNGLTSTILRRENILFFHDAAGEAAGGAFSAEAEVNLETGCISGGVSLKNAAIEKFPGVSAGSMAGFADADFFFSGEKPVLSALSGGGSIKMKGGEIKDVPFLYGLAPAMFRSSYKDSVFSEGRADFTLEKGVFTLKNARLLSEEVCLSGSGTIDLEGNIDIVLDAFSSEKQMRKQSAPVEMFSHLMKICDFFIIRHRITGNLEEPSYKPMPFPVATMLPLQLKRVLGFFLPMDSGERP